MKMRNIACNLIYNNGNEGVLVGFEGRCTVDNIIYNIGLGSGRWCSQQQCSCRQYFDSGFKKGATQFPCTESKLFTEWKFNAGFSFADNEALVMNETGAGKVAILTTKFPGTKEAERKIVGFFKIDSISNNNNEVAADPKFRLRLSLEDAKELNFWNYHRNKKTDKAVWNHGRFRYLDDLQIACILHDLLKVVQNKDEQSMILELLKTDFAAFADEKPVYSGAVDENVPKKILLNRKYGFGGESLHHKTLKRFISENPQLVGVKGHVKVTEEHRFPSNDLVDILFEMQSEDSSTVVEIELNHVEPGIHQAIKYRALRCSQLGLELDSSKVTAVVVAWKLSDSEKDLCIKYSIDYYEIVPPTNYIFSQAQKKVPEETYA